MGGGAGVVSRYHAEGLAARGHKVTVLTTWIKGEEEDSREDNLRLIKIVVGRQKVFQSGPVEFLKWLRAAKKYLASMPDFDFDIAMSHYLLPAGDVSYFLKKKFGLPYVCMSHGHDVPFVFPKQMLKFHLLTYFWLRRIARNSEQFLLLSEWLKDRADRFIGSAYRHKNTILNNGCDTDFFFPDASQRPAHFKMVFVGRLVEQKDPMALLGALKLFSEKVSDFEMHVLGDGPLRSKMEEYCRENGLSQVIFKGWVSKDEMRRQYQSAHAQVIAARFEGMSIAALESLSCGVWILSTNVSGMSDMIEPGKNGDFIKTKEPKGLASQIEEVYKERFLAKQDVDPTFLADFRGRFHWRHIVSEVEAILEEVLKKDVS